MAASPTSAPHTGSLRRSSSGGGFPTISPTAPTGGAGAGAGSPAATAAAAARALTASSGVSPHTTPPPPIAVAATAAVGAAAGTTVVVATLPTPVQEPLVLANEYGGSAVVKALTQDETTRMKALYDAVRNRIIIGHNTLLDKHGVRDHAQVRGFTIGIDDRTIKFLDNGGHQVEEPILGLMTTDPELKRLMEEMIQFADEKMPYNGSQKPVLDPTKKGSVQGIDPFDRSTPVLRSYRGTMEENSSKAYKLFEQSGIVRPTARRPAPTEDEQKVAALKRMAFAETFLKKFQDGIREAKADVNRRLNAARGVTPTTLANDAIIRELEDELKKIEALQSRLNKIDTYALAVALAFTPASGASATDMMERAEEARDAIQYGYRREHGEAHQSKYTKGNSFTNFFRDIGQAWRGNWEWHMEDRYNEDYAKDVGGLLFAGRDNGYLEYMKYCRSSDSAMKKHSLEDDFFDQMRKFSEDPGGYDIVGGLESLLEGISDPVPPVAGAGAAGAPAPAVAIGIIRNRLGEAQTEAQRINTVAATFPVTPGSDLVLDFRHQVINPRNP